jgi:hypothetical protein
MNPWLKQLLSRHDLTWGRGQALRDTDNRRSA